MERKMSYKIGALEIVEHVQEIISNTENEGITNVDVSKLKSFFSGLEKRIKEGYPDEDEASYEKLKLEWERNLKQWEAEVSWIQTGYKERLRSTVELAQLTLKSSILINGGAAIATLALLGQIWSPYQPENLLLQLASGTKYFAYGVLLAAISIPFAYLCEGAGISETKKGNNWSLFFWIIAVLLIVFSYINFGCGINSIYDAFIVG